MATLYYEIEPNTVFMTLGEYFVPGKTYFISPDLYNSELPDGSKVSDKCKSAKVVTSHPG